MFSKICKYLIIYGLFPCLLVFMKMRKKKIMKRIRSIVSDISLPITGDIIGWNNMDVCPFAIFRSNKTHILVGKIFFIMKLIKYLHAYLHIIKKFTLTSTLSFVLRGLFFSARNIIDWKANHLLSYGSSAPLPVFLVSFSFFFFSGEVAL